jgi:hypothetical protein
LIIILLSISLSDCKSEKTDKIDKSMKIAQTDKQNKPLNKIVDHQDKPLKNINIKYLIADKPETIKNSKLPENSMIQLVTLNDPSNWLPMELRYQDNPDIQIQLITNQAFKKEGLMVDETTSTLLAMANLWDAKAAQELFKNQVTAASSTTTKVDDKTSVSWIGIKGPGSSNILGYNTIRYYTNSYVTLPDGVTQYNKIADTDIYFNSGLRWTNNYNSAQGTLYDVGTVALHELGHTVGLDDIYNDPTKNYDTEQIMNYYDGKQRYLGAGDIKGTQFLWG